MIPSAEEVKEARRKATTSAKAYREALAAYQVEADKLAALQARTDRIGDTDEGGSMRSRLLSRAVSSVSGFLAGDTQATMPTDSELVAAAADGLRREIRQKMHEVAAERITAQREATADAAIAAGDALEYAQAVHAEALAIEAMHAMSAKASIVTATIEACKSRDFDGGFAWRRAGLHLAFPQGDAAPNMGDLPRALELGDGLSLVQALTIVAAREEREREARNRESANLRPAALVRDRALSPAEAACFVGTFR